MSKAKILIVEDDNTAAAVMKIYLTDLGYEIADIATNGQDALRIASQLYPDVVLLDIALGKGIDGIDTGFLIRQHLNIPVVFVTSHADQNTLHRAKHVGASGFINKPIRDTDLKTTLEFTLSNREENKKDKKAGADLESVLMSIYSLTKTEAKFAAHLLRVPDIYEVAKIMNISALTAKTHLKRIFRKTDTNRQSLLIHKLTTGPAGILLNDTTPTSEK